VVREETVVRGLESENGEEGKDSGRGTED